MSIKLRPGVNLEASFEKLKKILQKAQDHSDGDIAYVMLEAGMMAHIEECTEEQSPTSDDIPDDLFTTLGNICNPNPSTL